jgi:hypothetical protein
LILKVSDSLISNEEERPIYAFPGWHQGFC